ncbi:GbsR/MarR family transcriptional regulator [Streptacidiphilus jiangxiensis]|uniref:DNA-binding transcriptional regulator GbsR, MarR family n=1 Tax=Streptacidiphilus jiangxiensis TaxID=235985 RepID=A0A1H7Z8P2_STRJI|nr:MarR family transcriptional regulator [Streptacidiphilus jiangxiensis]SEM53847.1 DNA-binding transcriptional regulator GbsR, MarR family [Streptacidiphilus jiangxiensis]
MTADPDELHAYIERFTGVLTDSGFPRMPARVFVALMTSESGRLTAAELADTLQISPAAVSGAVRYLTQFQLVGREREPGSRRDRYRVFDQVWREAMLNRDFVLGRWQNALAEGVHLLGEGSAASARLGESLHFFTFLRRELPALLERYHREREAALDDGAAQLGAVQPSQPGRTNPDS